MKKRYRNGCIGLLLTLTMAVSTWAGATAKATEVQPSGRRVCTAVSQGTNAEAQNYVRCSNPVTSYLTKCADGRIMRVQGGISEPGVLVEYYNTDYEMLSSQIISEELPIFGGFYAADEYYFLLTGQTNEEESAETEVYRITKYDKDWNRLDSVGLKDCNTTVPFSSGSARMDTEGEYLIIRTCHKMYTSGDGLNHQANVTIQVNMKTMQITDSYTGVMNIDYGYVSHSFNQFIKADNNHIAAVDHGDAYPRSIVLIKYGKEISSGTFTSSNNKAIDVLTFPGAIGNNMTGASVGGFEISDTSYLIAGNSVVQDDDNLTRMTRNVFVAAVDKETDEVNMNWFTSYEEGDGTTSTPQLAAIGDGRYLVLWSRGNKVYYALVDGSGQKVGETYELEGGLSDCAPIVSDGKLVWYAWRNGTITFYEILLNDLSQNQTKEMEIDHAYEAQGEIVDGMVSLKCRICGKETGQMKVVTGMSIFWNQDQGNGYYYSVFDSEMEIGDTLYYWITKVLPEDADDKTIDIIVENPKIIRWTETSMERGMGYFTMLSPGETTITFSPRCNPSAKVSYTCTVAGVTEGENTENTENTETKPTEGGNTESTETKPTEGESTENTETKPAETPEKVAVSSILYITKTKTIIAGKKLALAVEVLPTNATDKSITWTSGNEKYATVDENGVVTAKSAGAGKTVMITASANDGSGVKTAIQLQIQKAKVTKVKLTAKKKTVKAGGKLKISAFVTTNGTGANKKLTWTTSNKKYATVNAKGVVTAKKAGKGKSVKITATAKDGSKKKATIKIKIK